MKGRLASLIASTSLLATLVVIVQHPAAESTVARAAATTHQRHVPDLQTDLVAIEPPLQWLADSVVRLLRMWAPDLARIGSTVERWVLGNAGLADPRPAAGPEP